MYTYFPRQEKGILLEHQLTILIELNLHLHIKHFQYLDKETERICLLENLHWIGLKEKLKGFFFFFYLTCPLSQEGHSLLFHLNATLVKIYPYREKRKNKRNATKKAHARLKYTHTQNHAITQ